MKLKYIIEEKDLVKEFLKKQGISRNLGKKIKLYGNIYINGKESFNYSEINIGDILIIEYQEKINPDIPLSEFSIDIIHEDDYLLIINKPINLSTQPSRKHIDDNLISRIKKYYFDQGINNNIHLVNRLDYSTSGLIIVAKDGFIHQQLADKTEIIKKYIAKVKGTFETEFGIINLPIERDSRFSILRRVSENGQNSITKYKVLSKEDDITILELTLLTGRCHQIRVHLSAVKHPIIGDKLYGEAENELFLHSYYLKFIHPFTNEEIEIIHYPNWY